VPKDGAGVHLLDLFDDSLQKDGAGVHLLDLFDDSLWIRLNE